MIIQNGIMLLSLAFVLFMVVRGVVRKRFKHALVFMVWAMIVLWFFNSPFFGFSAVTVSSRGIELDYGILSIRNRILPLDARCQIMTTMSGIKKLKRLYFLKVDGHESMKVRGREGEELLEAITRAIQETKSRRDAKPGGTMVRKRWRG
jgi:hypothetical protein